MDQIESLIFLLGAAALLAQLARRDLISAERDAVLSSRDGGEISPKTMRRIERDLDLEESRIGG